MKNHLVWLLAIAICLAGCAAKRDRVPTPPSRKKLIVLPGKTQDPKLKPYVVNGERYYPIPDAEGFVQFGKASWYGKKFHGRPTANGETFDMYKKTAAHKTLPLGTWVRVVNLAAKKEIVLRINDRGPFVKGRIIDLSYAAAKELGLVGPGVVEVKVVALGKEVGTMQSPLGVRPVVEVQDLKRGAFTIQVGAFRERGNALRLADRLGVIFDYVEISLNEDPDKGLLYRVWVSKSFTLEAAEKTEKKLENMGFDQAFVVGL